jgi:hypothetical protein
VSYGDLDRVFESPNELDSNGEPANVVDGLFAIARSLDRIADALHNRNDIERAGEIEGGARS